MLPQLFVCCITIATRDRRDRVVENPEAAAGARGRSRKHPSDIGE
jgi:hypothetical protein